MPAPESRLTLTREIARSAIATVWEGFDSSLDRKVLVKSIHPQYARESDLRARFEREAKAIAKLSHPNVVQIFDLRTEGDDLSLILEFVEGTTLRRVLKERGPLPAEAALTIADEILAGLEAAHAAGIIHRDLKPENVLVSARGEIKITDFGLASLKDQPTVTQEGMVVGTPSYMAPEQAGGGEVSPATDIFAVGLMLFEMLTGQRVHEGATMAETFQNVVKYQPPKLDAYGEQIPESVRPVLAAMLERAPAKRPTHAADVRQALADSGRDDRLPRTLIQDFLSEEPTRKPMAPAVARVRAWSKPFRWFTLLTLFVAGGGLIFHLATLKDERIPVLPEENASPAESMMVSPPTDAGIEATARDTMTAVAPETAAAESARQVAARIVVPLPSGRVPEPVIAERSGFLSVVSHPWAQVYIGDSLIGGTPLGAAVELVAGEHSVVFLNPEIGLPIIRTIRIQGGDTTQLRVNLYDHVGRVRAASVRPWADVYVDGNKMLRTPSSKTIFLTLGTHTLTLRHPDLPDYTETLTFREGDPVYEIRADLSQPR